MRNNKGNRFANLAKSRYAELSLAGVLRVLLHPRNSGVLLTLFQPDGTDYAHHITASTPGFKTLTTALKGIIFGSGGNGAY